MATRASLLFTLLLCVCVHTVVECDSSCSNMLECTMYTIQEVGRKVDNMQSNMADIVNQLTQIQVIQKQITENDQNQSVIMAEQAKVITEQGEMIAALQLENQLYQNSSVSFTASASETREYNGGDLVLFDSVLRNYGNSYYGENSTFICSHNAYYLFSVTVMTNRNVMNADIMLDDTALVQAYAYDWEAGTSLVVTYCGEGQSVWVKCNSGQGRVLYDNERYSSFSGTLLRLA